MTGFSVLRWRLTGTLTTPYDAAGVDAFNSTSSIGRCRRTRGPRCGLRYTPCQIKAVKSMTIPRTPAAADIEVRQDRWRLVAAGTLAMFIAMLDMSVVTVTLPVIEDDLPSTTNVTEWVVLGYLLSGIALTICTTRGAEQHDGSWREEYAGRSLFIVRASTHG
jgi:hypothetical protein